MPQQPNTQWTQEKFNADHIEPRDYGEGDYYVVADTYADEEAAALISKWLSQLTGDEYAYAAKDVSAVKMFVNDQNDDGVDDWYVHNFSDAKPVAWGKAVCV